MNTKIKELGDDLFVQYVGEYGGLYVINKTEMIQHEVTGRVALVSNCVALSLKEIKELNKYVSIDIDLLIRRGRKK